MPGPVKIPVTDQLDLHTFHPDEVEDLLLDYFQECLVHQIFQVRVIHGKGSGTLKKRVWAALGKNPLVAAFHQAPPEAGGWGATLVTLKKPVKTAPGN